MSNEFGGFSSAAAQEANQSAYAAQVADGIARARAADAALAARNAEDHARNLAILASARALVADGQEVVEVIETAYQTGAVYELIRPWDGLLSRIGAIEARDGRVDGSRMVVRPYIELHRSLA